MELHLIEIHSSQPPKLSIWKSSWPVREFHQAIVLLVRDSKKASTNSLMQIEPMKTKRFIMPKKVNKQISLFYFYLMFKFN